LKNVYTDFRSFIIVGLLFLSGGYLEYKNPSFIHVLILAFVGVVFLISLYTLFFPFWSYDQSGFQKWSIFGRKKYKWADVKQIKSLGLIDHFSLVTNDDEYLVLGYFFTRDYSKVALDVLGLLRKINKNIKIPESFLKQINRLN